MNFEITNNEKYTVLKSKVEKLDTNFAPELKSELVLINKAGQKNIIIDLSETRYCDSSGLSAILVANRLCKGLEGSFVLTGLQDAVMKLVTISQLHTVLNITPTFNEAHDYIMMEEVERDLNNEE
jgi:anti-sigma B factor antagonist